MCTFVEELRAEGKAEGKAEGIINTCKAFGLDAQKIVDQLVSQLNISQEEAKEILANYES